MQKPAMPLYELAIESFQQFKVGKVGKMSSFDDLTFLNRWGLTFLGIWRNPESDKNPRARLLGRVHVSTLYAMMMLLLVPQWLDLYVLWGNIDANAETFVLNVFTITALLKLSCFLAARDVFEDVIGSMKASWNATMSKNNGPEQREHRRILLDMGRKARSYTKRYGLLMYSTASMYFVSPFLGMQQNDLRVRKYPFFGWYYFDRFSNFYYALCYTSQLMIGIVVGTSNYAMDSIFLVAIYHCCAQLRILQHDLARIGQSGSCKKEELTRLIRRHQREIGNSRKLEELFNGSSLQQLLVSCIIICVIGFKLIISLNEGGFEFLVYVAFMFVALLQIFLYCRPGDELIAQSTAIGQAAYQSHWTSLDMEAVRHITMIILRSQRPLKMTAGKIYVLSLPNFTMILKTSMSFLSLLRAMYIKSDDRSSQ